MPKGIYERTEFHKSRCGFIKGHTVNLGKPSPVKGRKLTDEHKSKMTSMFKKGHSVFQETRNKISKSKTGLKASYEARKNISNGHKGQISWNKGVPKSSEEIERMRRTKLGDELYEYREKHGYTRSELNYFYSSSKWKKIRNLIYKRDNYICQECRRLCTRTSISSSMICCHHIDYNVNNNDASNLITLCQSCHVKTNFNRCDWTQRYRNIVV